MVLAPFAATIFQIAFSVVAVLLAMFGVVMQNDALDYADLGEVPDFGGASFLAGSPGDPYETARAFYIDLRRHYRLAAATLSKTANFILLVSVVAGVLAGFTSNVALAALLAIFWAALAVFLGGSAYPRSRRLRAAENGLEVRRLQYNESNFGGLSAVQIEEKKMRERLLPIKPFKRIRF